MSHALTPHAEHSEWIDAYSDPVQHRRRKQKMLSKLKNLGVDRLDRSARIVDICCGMGEALEVLYELGFRDLHGVDLTLFPDRVCDERFNFVLADARRLPLGDGTADVLLNIHSLHHFETADNVRVFVEECHRVLRPGGYLGIVDFPASLQIKLAFRMFLHKWWLLTPYLRWFGSIVQAEWQHFLPGYLRDWPTTAKLLFDAQFQLKSKRSGLFYYYVMLIKQLNG